MVVPELDILGGERRTVRPLVPLAQVEGQLREVAVPRPVLGDIRHNGLKIVGVAH